MGIDMDVSFVYHTTKPLTLADYVQQIGRGGRRGSETNCRVFLCNNDDGILKRFLSRDNIDRSSISTRDLEIFQVQNMSSTEKCWWNQIDEHFGISPTLEECGTCNYCKIT